MSGAVVMQVLEHESASLLTMSKVAHLVTPGSDLVHGGNLKNRTRVEM